jgi:protein TonB
MLKVLLETNSTRSRRIGGTLTSALVHGALLAGAIVLTVPAGPVGATSAPPEPAPIFIPINRAPQRQMAHHREPPVVRHPAQAPTQSVAIDWTPDIKLTEIAGPLIPTGPDEPVGLGLPTGSLIGSGPDLSSGDGGVVDALLADRAPHLLGRPLPPTYPTALRHTGKSGRVVAQFVVDTTGRVERGSLNIMETADPLFADAVQAVLPRYRFSPGEAHGRRVRTLVQLPFEFTLTR